MVASGGAAPRGSNTVTCTAESAPSVRSMQPRTARHCSPPSPLQPAMVWMATSRRSTGLAFGTTRTTMPFFRKTSTADVATPCGENDSPAGSPVDCTSKMRGNHWARYWSARAGVFLQCRPLRPGPGSSMVVRVVTVWYGFGELFGVAGSSCAAQRFHPGGDGPGARATAGGQVLRRARPEVRRTLCEGDPGAETFRRCQHRAVRQSGGRCA
jgi:hypothetical protein